jgi:prepilin-type N-terminal cleavage/methylation domain-containing protein
MERMPFNKAPEAGMTLVELMVSVGLFGILSLGLAEMFASNSRMSARAQNESKLSEQVVDFSQALENYLTNATQILGCNCANGCVLPDLTGLSSPPAGTDCMSGNNCGSGSTAAPGADILIFEYEDANNPTDPAINGQCEVTALGGLVDAKGRLTNNGISPDALTLRGCKKRIHLTAIQPTAPTATAPGSPGQLALYLEDPANPGSLLPDPVKVVGGISSGSAGAGQMTGTAGVFQMFCGQTPIPGTAIAAPDHFRIQFSVKTRTNNTQDVTSPFFEGWTPGSANFNLGIQRTYNFDISMHNLNVPGVQFGKSQTLLNCTQDGGNAPDGNCCSGYMDVNGNCLPMAGCTVSGQAPPTGIWSECCSHKIFSVTGNCT